MSDNRKWQEDQHERIKQEREYAWEAYQLRLRQYLAAQREKELIKQQLRVGNAEMRAAVQAHVRKE